jgi:hypothetical protein
MRKKLRALLSICLVACMMITMMTPLTAEAASKTKSGKYEDYVVTITVLEKNKNF